MFELTTENVATLVVDGTAIVLLIGIFLETSIMRKRGRDDDKLFFGLLIFNAIFALADIVTYLADRKDFSGARYLNMGGVSISYIVLVFTFMTWFYYCMVRFQGIETRLPKKKKLLFIPGLIIEALLFVNFFTGFVFNVDENNIYHYGILFVPMFIIMGFYFVMCIRIIHKYSTGADKKELIPVWLYMLPLVVGLIVPFVLKGISLTSVGLAMSICFTHLGSASEIVNSDEFSDTEGGETV